MLKNIIKKIENKIKLSLGSSSIKIGLNDIISDLKKEAELQKEMLNALIDDIILLNSYLMRSNDKIEKKLLELKIDEKTNIIEKITAKK